jgi:hypothetical protein
MAIRGDDEMMRVWQLAASPRTEPTATSDGPAGTIVGISLSPGNGSGVRHETASGQGWCPEAA